MAGVIKVRPDVTLTATGLLIVEAFSYCPLAQELYVTSSKRWEPGSHHHDGTAVDFGFYDDPESDTIDQYQAREVARWAFSEIGVGTFKEFIHTTPFPDDNGFYVKWGNVVAPFAAADHVNHIHAAADYGPIKSAVDRLKRKYPLKPRPDVVETPESKPGSKPSWKPALGAVI